MTRVAVVVDSTASLPPELVAEHGILVVPMRLTFGDETFRDGVDIQPAEFYRRLALGRLLPKTASPPPGEFLDAFRRAAERGAGGVLCLTLARELSSTHQAASLAAEQAQEAIRGLQIRVIDSRTAGGAEGLVALEAARSARQDLPLGDVVATAERAIRDVQFIGALDTLHYIWKGGRIPRAALWATSLLRIKPILEIRHGQVPLVEKPRTRKRAFQRLIAIVVERAQGRQLRLMVLHGDAPQEAQALAAELKRKLHCKEMLVSTFTPVIGAHTGPGLLGVAFLPVED